MSDYLFGREILLNLDGKLFDGKDIDMTFSIPFTEDEEPDISEISIFNVSRDTIDRLKPNMSVNLSAGYTGNTGTLLLGSLRTWDYDDTTIDKELKLFLTDGSSKWLSQKVSLSLTKNIKASQVLGVLFDRFNLEIGPILLANDITYNNGKVFNTTLYDAISTIVKETGSKLYVKQGMLFIRPEKDGALIGFTLNASSGLIGSPRRKVIEETVKDKTTGEEVTKERTVYELDCLLNHRLTLGSYINVDSKTLKGNCLIISGEHTSDFVTSVEVVKV